jgi:hypothetical protein
MHPLHVSCEVVLAAERFAASRVRTYPRLLFEMYISEVSAHVCSKAEGGSFAPNDFADISFLMRCADMFAVGISV